MKNKGHLFLIYIFVLLFSMLIIFEYVILPWHFHLPRQIALLGFTAEPDITVDDTSINQMGFTGDVIDYKKDPEKIRILTLGGSSMFNRRMTERLKSSLNSVSNRPVEVLGAALRTHTSMSSLIKYRVLSKYEFDYVLIYHGINDLFVNNVESKYYKSDYSHMLPWYKRNMLLDNSLVARVLYNNFIWGKRIFGGEKVWFIYPDDKIANAMNFVSVELFKRNMTMLVEDIKRNGSAPVLMTFAWNIPDNYNSASLNNGTSGYNNPEKYDQYPVELWGPSEFVKGGLKMHNNIVRRIAEDNNIYLIDQEKLIGKDMKWFGDVCHLSEEGTDKFISNILDYFTEYNLL